MPESDDEETLSVIEEVTEPEDHYSSDSSTPTVSKYADDTISDIVSINERVVLDSDINNIYENNIRIEKHQGRTFFKHNQQQQTRIKNEDLKSVASSDYMASSEDETTSMKDTEDFDEYFMKMRGEDYTGKSRIEPDNNDVVTQHYKNLEKIMSGFMGLTETDRTDNDEGDPAV